MAMPGSCAEGPLLVEKPVDGLKSMRRQRGLQFPTVGNFLWLGLRWEQPPRSTWNKLLGRVPGRTMLHVEHCPAPILFPPRHPKDRLFRPRQCNGLPHLKTR
jgi:hypothetical protein